MSKETIGPHVPTLQEIRETLKATAFNSIRKVLPDSAIRAACRAAGFVGRERVLTPVVMVVYMVVVGLWPEESLAACWQMMWGTLHSLLPGLKRRRVTSGALSRARGRLPLAMWDHLFEYLSVKAQRMSESASRWRGHRLVLIDGTTVSTADTPDLHQEFGATFSRGKRGKFPLVRMVTAALAGTMTVIGYRLGRYDDSEISLTWPLLDDLHPGDLVIADRLFAAAHYYVRYLRRGLQFITCMHAGLTPKSLSNLRQAGPNDFIGLLRVNKKGRHADPWMPKFVEVRIIGAPVRIRGKRTMLWLVTSLRDPVAYPVAEILELYRRRWRIETLLEQVKVNLKADVLRSQTVEGVKKEIAARLIAVNVVRMIMLEAALKEGIDPLRISFVQTVRTVLAFAGRLATAHTGDLLDIYEAMLRQIAVHQVPWRPDRIEPRMIKREVKHYPSLKVPRSEWRQKLVA